MTLREEYNKNRQKYYDELFAQSNGCCFNCEKSGVEFHVHHIVPLASGGTNNRFNLSLLCLTCHGEVHQKDFLKMSELSKKARKKSRTVDALIPEEQWLPPLISNLLNKTGVTIEEYASELEKHYYISKKERKKFNRALRFAKKVSLLITIREVAWRLTRTGLSQEERELIYAGNYQLIYERFSSDFRWNEIPYSLIE